ncbi:MAG: gas vesicle protein K [Syntrophomonas sp.]
MELDIKEDNLKHGLLGLVMALVEIIRDALEHQALNRIESGILDADEIEILGQALMDLDIAIEEIKAEQGITESVQGVRDGLDEVVDNVIDRLLNPERWREDADEQGI